MAQELWQLAKPFGRPAMFKSAEELWAAFERYIEWSVNNPMTIQDTKRQTARGAAGEKTQYKQTIARPLSITAFCLHAGIKREWYAFKNDYSAKSEDFCRVIIAIEKSIRQQQVDNAMVGNYKENLVARLNNIADTIENKVTAQASVKGMSVSEAQAFLDKLNEEI